MKQVICVDLDGVIFEYKEWRGLDHFGKPLPKVRESLQLLKKAGFKILVYSTRLNYQFQKEQPRILLEKVKRALDQSEIPYDEIFTGPAKPFALFYLDDRGIHFENWEQALKEIFSLWESFQNAWTNKASRTKKSPNK